MSNALVYSIFFINIFCHPMLAIQERTNFFPYNQPSRLKNSLILKETPIIHNFFSQQIIPTESYIHPLQEQNFRTEPNYDYNFLQSSNSYIGNGRLLNQYEVSEPNNEEPHLFGSNLFESYNLPSGRSLQHSFNLQDSYKKNFLNADFNFLSKHNFHSQQRNQNRNSIPIFGKNNHGSVALGSGSLGYIRLPNGGVYVGSGSLGYTSEKQHVETLRAAKQNKIFLPMPGPLIFGHG